MKSMTAFARNQVTDSFGTLIWELRSVNHRYLDLHMRLPDEMRAMEGSFRELISAQLKRGKIECNLRFKSDASVKNGVEVNKAFAKEVIHACEELNSMIHQSTEISVVDLLNWPGVVEEAAPDMKPAMLACETLLTQSLQDLISNREREGGRLKTLITQRCDEVEKIVLQVREFMPEVRDNHRQKMLSRFEELKADPDMDRIEQELLHLVQKMDVDEELDRLDAHIKELNDVLNRDEAVGRRLDFLMQELNREANTLGSKSADIRMTQASVELKVLIEQMREQIQNIE
jgi:uncharacterized protein (TIGR00255 family)